MARLSRSRAERQSQRGGHWPPRCVLFLALLPGLAYAGGWQGRNLFESYSYSAPVPITEVADAWAAPLSGGGTILSWNRMSLGIAKDGMHLGLTRRAIWQAQLDPQTARFIHLTKNHQSLPVGERFDLRLDLVQYDLSGVEIGLPVTLNRRLRLIFMPAWLEGERFTVGSVRGSATANAANDYDLDLHADYLYRDDPLFGRDNLAPKGRGYSVDASLEYDYNDSIGFRMEVNNLISRIDWRDAPATLADANSQNKSYDADGYLVFEPTLSGREYYRDYVQTLPWRALMVLDWRLSGPWGVQLRQRRCDSFEATSVGVDFRVSPGQRARLTYTPRFDAFTLAWEGRRFGIAVGGDAVDPADLHQLTLEMRLEMPLTTL